MGYDSVEIANFIMESNLFANASPAFEIRPSISYDPSVLDQWGLYNSIDEGIDISASEAWNYATGRGVTVAVIDSGIDLEHEDLADNILGKSYDAESGESPSRLYTNSDLSHGTHCAGIIGAVRNNNLGLSGVAPEVSLMSISVNFSSPDIEAQLADGINWAWKNGADILSCSWNAPVGNSLIKRAIDNAIINGREQLGSIFVVSSGNGLRSGTPVKFPADYREEIIAVGNIQTNGILNTKSCIGDAMFVCAPGTNILSTIVGNSYEEMNGTSMACAHVSGVVALMLDLNPTLTNSEVKEIIARSTKKIGHLPYATSKKYGIWNEYYGYGLIDASKAVINTIEQSLNH
ncbi:MAG: S8 family serine peptidase [Muribaculaceae bacterium]|nr:S8 family serine peptidase [Muribaculaceae bacterium]